jgi:hypothetical protein
MKAKLLKKVRKRVKIFYNHRTKLYDLSIKNRMVGWIWIRGYDKETVYSAYRYMIIEVCKTDYKIERKLNEIKHAEK